MSVAGVDSLFVLREMQDRNDAIRREFLSRTRILNRIRSDVYLSGTFVRDYLLEPEARKADLYRAKLAQPQQDMNEALTSYRALAGDRENSPYQALATEAGAYWNILAPVMAGRSEPRPTEGYIFLRDEVYPRRLTMLGLVDQLAGMNEQQLHLGDQQVAALSAQLRFRLILTLLVTLGLGALLAAFSTGKVLRLEHESAARYSEISQARSELKELSARLVAAQETERRSLSRELHDEVGQSLSALLVGLSNLRASGGEALQSQVDGLRKLVESTVGVVRNLTLLLRPSMLDDLGLVPALQWQARETSKRTGLLVNVAADNVSDDLPETHKTCIYRVVQEALHNTVRHADAHNVKIAVRQETTGISLSVQDDGKGFRPETGRGVGLLGMHERVVHLGGSFRIESAPGHGTLLLIFLPCVASSAASI